MLPPPPRIHTSSPQTLPRCHVQAIVLTHSGAPVEERMPYHNVRMHGLRPLIFRERCADEEPQIYVRGAMYCFYRDRSSLQRDASSHALSRHSS